MVPWPTSSNSNPVVYVLPEKGFRAVWRDGSDVLLAIAVMLIRVLADIFGYGNVMSTGRTTVCARKVKASWDVCLNVPEGVHSIIVLRISSSKAAEIPDEKPARAEHVFSRLSEGSS